LPQRGEKGAQKVFGPSVVIDCQGQHVQQSLKEQGRGGGLGKERQGALGKGARLQ
jgi:hypothetical protein